MARKGKLLIIDDEEKLRKLLFRIISLEGYEVEEAGTLNEGRRKLEKNQYHLVLCDVKLPDGNGVDFVPEFKSKYPITEIVLLTAYGTIKDGVQAMRSGAFDYLTKGDVIDGPASTEARVGALSVDGTSALVGNVQLGDVDAPLTVGRPALPGGGASSENAHATLLVGQDAAPDGGVAVKQEGDAAEDDGVAGQEEADAAVDATMPPPPAPLPKRRRARPGAAPPASQAAE